MAKVVMRGFRFRHQSIGHARPFFLFFPGPFFFRCLDSCRVMEKPWLSTSLRIHINRPMMTSAKH